MAAPQLPSNLEDYNVDIFRTIRFQRLKISQVYIGSIYVLLVMYIVIQYLKFVKIGGYGTQADYLPKETSMSHKC